MEISRLQYITTNAAAAELACQGGADWVQLRLKDVSYDAYLAAGRDVQAVCRKYGATFIINDNIKLALALGADGVHVGKDDPLPPGDVKEMLARNGIIGCTANEVADFEHLAGKPVSYIGLGPFRFTTTKQKLSPILGIEGYRHIFAALAARNIPHPPVVAIGGITEADVPELMTTGIHGIAVSGAIGQAANPVMAAFTLNRVVHAAVNTVHKKVLIHASAARVWQALTTPGLMKEWLFDTPIYVTTDWKPGSDISFRGTWFKRDYEDRGTVLQVAPEQLLQYNLWSWLSRLPDTPEHRSEVTFTLHPNDQGTVLKLRHGNLPDYSAYGHVHYYWTLTLDRLRKFIENQ